MCRCAQRICVLRGTAFQVDADSACAHVLDRCLLSPPAMAEAFPEPQERHTDFGVLAVTLWIDLVGT